MSGHNIFISYKYKDSISYVGKIQKKIENTVILDHSEKPEESLEGYSDEYIERHLFDKLYGTTVTIVLLSPNMKTNNVAEKNQWIPQEISYSLSNFSRNGRHSSSNALLLVDLPENRIGIEDGKYYPHFNIIKENVKNGYATLVDWKDFFQYPHMYIDRALKRRDEFSGIVVKKP